MSKRLPISFSPLMVRALRAGLKTETRRVITPQPNFQADGCKNADMGGRNEWWDYYQLDNLRTQRFKLKYAEGDTLWVKEALRRGRDTHFVKYEATDDFAWQGKDEDAELVSWPWKPEKLAAMYCPEWASRTNLLVKEVKIEQLHEITESGAIAEGVKSVEEYRKLWCALHNEKSWNSNPWVAVYRFREVV